MWPPLFRAGKTPELAILRRDSSATLISASRAHLAKEMICVNTKISLPFFKDKGNAFAARAANLSPAAAWLPERSLDPWPQLPLPQALGCSPLEERAGSPPWLLALAQSSQEGGPAHSAG